MTHQLQLKFNEELKPRKETEYIILHPSGVKSRHTAEDIHRWHQNRGWAGIGYHYFINKEGEIYTCRPRDTVGAHAKDYNQNSIGVCFEGDFNKEKMTDAQLSLYVIEFIRFLRIAYPGSSVRFCDELDGHKTPNIEGFRKADFWDGYEVITSDPGEFDRMSEEDFQKLVEFYIDGDENL